MAGKAVKKIQTDNDVKRKAVKLVLTHLKKKIPESLIGADGINEWIIEMEDLLAKEDFNLVEYFNMRRSLNDVIERILDEETRFRLRDSWYSLGKALDKKVKQR
ncbi:MAG: hypothetical protein PHG48_04790 [Eubacteriales bacterium]|nr:hypothetical protein [Eubacteriales bacterium]